MPFLPPAQRIIARAYCFQLRLFVSLFVRMFVCQHDYSCTIRDIITKFSGHHQKVERADKLENGYCGVRGWWCST